MIKNKKTEIINLILPKHFINLKFNKQQRLYFLAGPIRGAGDWQKEAIKILAKKDKNCYIVCPCRYDEAHELYKYSLPLQAEEKILNKFPNQTLWERYYLDLASYYGTIIFWLPLESKVAPRKKEDGPYARDTLGEIGRWSIRSKYKLGLSLGGKIKKKVNLVIGAHEEFPGLSVIRKNLEADHGKKYNIYNSLERTIKEAVKLAKK